MECVSIVKANLNIAGTGVGTLRAHWLGWFVALKLIVPTDSHSICGVIFDRSNCVRLHISTVFRHSGQEESSRPKSGPRREWRQQQCPGVAWNDHHTSEFTWNNIPRSFVPMWVEFGYRWRLASIQSLSMACWRATRALILLAGSDSQTFTGEFIHSNAPSQTQAYKSKNHLANQRTYSMETLSILLIVEEWSSVIGICYVTCM